MDGPLQSQNVRCLGRARGVRGGFLEGGGVLSLRLAAALLAIAATSATPLTDWPHFRGDDGLTGAGGAEPPSPLAVVWTYEAGEAIESSAAIAEGSVYVGTRTGELLALDLETGRLRWKYKTTAEEGIGESSPAVTGGLVYVGDYAGTLHAVDTRDGQGRFTFKTGKEIKSSPVVAEGKVLFGSYDETLYALDAKTGALAWKLPTEGPVHATPAVAGGLTYVTGCDQLLRAVRISDGHEVFHVASGGYTGASAAVVGDRAYYGTFENEVLGVDLKGRKVLWRYEHPQRKFPFYSSAAVAEGKVILGGRDKLVHALEAATGKLVWSFATQARIDSSPAVAGRRVFIGSNDGRLYVLDLGTGEKVQEFDAGAPLSASPSIAGGRVVIGSQDGRLYCLGAKR